jgi:hypothetical protein
MAPIRSLIRTDEEEDRVEERSPSMANNERQQPTPNGKNGSSSSSGAEWQPSTPPLPSVPTPPWLSTSLPPQTSSREEGEQQSSVPSPPNGIRLPPIRASLPQIDLPLPSSSSLYLPSQSFAAPPRGALISAPPFQPTRFRSASPPEMPNEDIRQDLVSSNNHSNLQHLGPLTCTTLTQADAMLLREQLKHDINRLAVLGHILKSMQELKMPNHDTVWNLLIVTEGGYNCPFPDCPRHKDGWTRADRTRAHIYADHLMIRYKCDKWCVLTRVFAPPLTMSSNSYFKREQDFNIHVASHDKQPAFECSLW